MGRLLNPGLGELADRFTILQLKIFNGKPTETMHFHAEQAQVLMTMERMHGSVLQGTATAKRIEMLRDTNRRLWELEDRMAEYAKAGPAMADPIGCACTAVEIWRYNRHRNELIDEINKLAGNFQGAEKL